MLNLVVRKESARLYKVKRIWIERWRKIVRQEQTQENYINQLATTAAEFSITPLNTSNEQNCDCCQQESYHSDLRTNCRRAQTLNATGQSLGDSSPLCSMYTSKG